MSAPQPRAKDRALRLLSSRSRSREELRRRLLRAGFHPSEIESAIEDLEGVGLVDDERFAQELTRHEAGRRGKGRRAVVASLRRAGLETAVVERAVMGLENGEEERAIGVAEKRARALTSLDPKVARKRLFEFLLRRGYSYETARAACRKVLGDEGDP
ncbi:MAG: regulatory protein RecX [Actinomycetota bacterium]